MPIPLSAVDTISPAFAQTKRLLFAPFRFRVWARLSVVAILTGEFLSGGWGGSYRVNFPTGQGDRRLPGLRFVDPSIPQELRENLAWIALAIAAALAIGVLLIYVSSVYRFVLFDAVLNSRYGLRGGWRRWRYCGRKLCWWTIGFGLVTLAALAFVVGGPVGLAWRAGWFHRPIPHLGLLILGGVALLLLAIGLILVSAVVDLFAKDFLVPVLALENCGVFEGWRRLERILRKEKGACAAYVLMKIVLAVGSAILFGVVNLIAFLLFLIPVGVVGGVVFGIWKAAGLTWSVATVSAVVLLALAALGAIFWLMGLIYAPGLVFFQSYTLHFLGSRYPALGVVMYPAPPASEPPPEPFAPPAPVPTS